MDSTIVKSFSNEIELINKGYVDHDSAISIIKSSHLLINFNYKETKIRIMRASFTGELGYEIYIPEYLNNYFMENNISIDSQIELEIYYHVTERQPKPLLVGFISYADKEFFEQLIQVLRLANQLQNK